jgi:hypothetical protein
VSEPFSAAAARLSGVEERILRESADRFNDIAKASLGRALGGGTVMLLHGRKGRRRPVRMSTKSNLGHSVLFVEGIPHAQWIWLEEGTKGHRIPKGRRKTFLKGAGYGHPVRSLWHPGATGKRTWTQTVETFRAEYPKIVTVQVKKALDG